MTPAWYLAALAYVALPATLFVIVYHVIARWWETAIGRNIMLLVGSIATTLDLGFLNLALGRPEWMRWVFFACYMAIGTAIWIRLHLLIKAQRDAPLETSGDNEGEQERTRWPLEDSR